MPWFGLQRPLPANLRWIVPPAISEDVRVMPQRRGIAGGDYSSRPGAELPELAAAAMSGNEAAFEQIHRRLSGGLIRFFLTRTRGQASVAEELAQTTWVHLWRSLRDRRYDPARSAISTFVYAIGHH